MARNEFNVETVDYTPAGSAHETIRRPHYHGALRIATRHEVVQRAGGAEPSDRDPAGRAANLDTAVRTLGA